MTSPLLIEHESFAVEIETPTDGPPAIAAFVLDGRRLGAGSRVPLVEVNSPTYGHRQPVQRLSCTLLGDRLRFVESRPVEAGFGNRTVLVLAEPESGLGVEVELTIHGAGTLTATTTVQNHGADPLVLTAVTSLNVPATFAIDGSAVRTDDLELCDATGDWLGESRWRIRPVRELLADLRLGAPEHTAKGQYAAVSRGTWSTADALPVGILTAPAAPYGLAWQVEHNGAWRTELAQNGSELQLSLSGPTDLDHGWLEVLEPGESFSSVPVTVSLGTDLESAVAALTRYRRLARRPHPDNKRLTLIYNDYMNTLMGDPTTAKLLPLIDAAAAAGAEVFCIDAGWYDDTGNWWDGVGEWTPSTTRFPGGLAEVLDRIRERQMVPGLWLEPEVVGVRSPMVDKLPVEAFFARGGVRLREAGRYQLDLRHPAARAHLDEVVDRLVADLGVGFFKLDYNINPGAGTERDADSVGAGLLGHNRAVLDWLDKVLDRHPDLVLENCSSGAMRMDFALLSRMQLQSTTDQTDLASYAPISVAAPVSMLPEQVGSWAYPSAEMSLEETAYSLSLGMLGRLYLSGLLDRVSADQQALVREAVTVYKGLRSSIAERLPVWPLGLPGWTDAWVALGLAGADDLLLTVFRRPGAGPATELFLPEYAGGELSVETLYPAGIDGWSHGWDPETGVLGLECSVDSLSARTFRVARSSS